MADVADDPGMTTGNAKRRGRGPTLAVSSADGGDEDDGTAAAPARASAAQRRRSVEAIVTVWTDVARDLAVVGRGLASSARDIGLLDESRRLAERLDPDAVVAFLDRLGRATTLLAGNVSPELVLDDLVLTWPRPTTGL